MEEQIGKWSSEFHLNVDPSALIWQLSVGEQQRVEIVKLLCRGAEILILDEPSAVLTAQEAKEMFHVLRRMADSGKSVVVISHKMNELWKIKKKEVWLRKALFLIVSLALFFPMMAQTITVKGVVKESMTGEPIIGANVAVKGTTNGTISDISGMYQISNVSSNAVLIVSYIGYKTAEIPVNGKNTINVSLEEEVSDFKKW